MEESIKGNLIELENAKILKNEKTIKVLSIE